MITANEARKIKSNRVVMEKIFHTMEEKIIESAKKDRRYIHYYFNKNTDIDLQQAVILQLSQLGYHVKEKTFDDPGNIPDNKAIIISW